MPPAPPLGDPQPRYSTAPYMEREFWKPFNRFSQPPSTQLGGEILTALRSTRGGIYYTKSNHFKQVDYVDRYPIYTCAFVPSHMIPYNEDTPLSTELGRGLVRKEALDLLAYSYTETPTGSFSISANLELVCGRYPSDLLRLPANLALKGRDRRTCQAFIPSP